MKTLRVISPEVETAVIAGFGVVAFFGLYVMSGKGPILISWIPDPVNSFLFVSSILVGVLLPFIVARRLLSQNFRSIPEIHKKIIYALVCVGALFPSFFYFRMLFDIMTGSI
jgi:hypothetical protein